MLMPQLTASSAPASGETPTPFDDDPVVRAARQVRDAAVAERRRANGEDGEEEEKGQREAKLQEDRKMQEAKEKARREKEKNDEEVYYRFKQSNTYNIIYLNLLTCWLIITFSGRLPD